MAQLRDSTIDGNLDVNGAINLQVNNKGIRGMHPVTGGSSMLYMSEDGHTDIGHGGYVNRNGNTRIYGNDIEFCSPHSNDNYFRPYYKAGDVINFAVRVSGYTTNGGKRVFFTVPVTKPIIGSPTATAESASSDGGFLLVQNGIYTHGSSVGSPVSPTSYSVSTNYNSGFVVTANFDVATDAVGNSPIGIYWNGKITLS